MPMTPRKKYLMSNRTSYRCLKKWQKMANFRHLFLKKSEQLFAAVPDRPAHAAQTFSEKKQMFFFENRNWYKTDNPVADQIQFRSKKEDEIKIILGS